MTFVLVLLLSNGTTEQVPLSLPDEASCQHAAPMAEWHYNRKHRGIPATAMGVKCEPSPS